MNEKLGVALKRARTAVDRLSHLIEALLDFSRLDRGAAVVDPQDTTVADIVHSARQIYDQRILSEGRRFEVSIGVSDGSLRVDPLRIGQVLSNLLDNAIKFTSPGGLILLRVTDTAEEIRFEVRDDGEGIPAEYHKRIFDQFVQIGREYGPGAKGLGLGLAICKGIVEKHGGHIWVESEPGKGSAFFFTLPRRDKSGYRVCRLP